MTQELWVAVWAGVIGLITLLAAPAVAYATPGYPKWNAGPRDTPFDLPPMVGRLNRAFANFMETYIIFVVVAVCLNFAAQSDWISTWGAHIYVVGRVAYVPLYLWGVPGPRSIAWGFSLLGIVMCLFSLLFKDMI